jgi:hypothetical protein
MPLPKHQKRRLLHDREISCRGYVRDDGLIEIEAQLTDTKPFDIQNKDRGGKIIAGEALHGMAVRIALDQEMTIREAAAAMDDTPYNYCKQVEPAYASLVGISIGPGWRGKIRDRVGGAKGCTHLTELLPVVATTAFQTLVSLQQQMEQDSSTEDYSDYVPHLINTCRSHAEDSPVVRDNWPEFYRGAKGRQ